MNIQPWVIYTAAALIVWVLVALVIARVEHNKSKRYGDYPKDLNFDAALGWPLKIVFRAFEAIINIVLTIGEYSIVRPLFWVVDKFVPNDTKIYERDL